MWDAMDELEWRRFDAIDADGEGARREVGFDPLEREAIDSEPRGKTLKENGVINSVESGGEI